MVRESNDAVRVKGLVFTSKGGRLVRLPRPGFQSPIIVRELLRGHV